MSYYNQPLYGRLGKAKAIQKWHTNIKWHTKLKMAQANGKLAHPISKTMQAIFLPGAWGKIPVFMGKNHPTPGAAMSFSHAQNYPPFCTSKKVFKNFCFKVLTTPFESGNLLALIKKG